MSKKVWKDFNRCGGVVATTDLSTYLGICQGALKEEKPFFGEVISEILPIGVNIRHYNSVRFKIVESCTFKLASGEFVRVHWHTEDPSAPVGSNAISNKIIRVNVNSNECFLLLKKDKTVSLKQIDSTSTMEDIDNTHIKVYYREDL